MAQKKNRTLTPDEKRSLTLKAAHSLRLSMLSEEADKNLALTEQWRTLLPEHKEIVLYRLYGGDTVAGVCKLLGIEKGLIYQAAYLDPEFKEEFKQAQEIGEHARVDRLLEIPFDDTLSDGAKKLLSDNIKWRAARVNRAAYGEHVQVDTNIQSHVVVPNWMGLPPVIDAQSVDEEATALPTTLESPASDSPAQ